jgi:hypothetical protein
MDLLGGPMDVDVEDDDIMEVSDDTKPRSPMAPASGAPESINLAETMSPADLKKIGSKVCKDFDADVDSGSKHMQRLKRWQELYSSVMHAKTWPFDRAANVNVPILTYTVLQIQGRLYDMIIPSKGEIFHSVPTDQRPEELDRANRTEMHVNYWARHETPEFVHVYDELLYQMGIYGSSFSCYMWDPIEERIVPECIKAADMVVPFDAKATSPQMKGVPRYTRIRWMSWFEIQDKGDEGFFINTEDIKPGKAELKQSGSGSEFKEVVNEISGQEKSGSDDDENEPRQVLEQHIRWLKLPKDPKNPKLDGKPHAAIVWVDAESEKVLRIVLREEPSPKDAVRFQKEDAAFQAYQSQVQQHEASGGVTMDQATGQLVPLPTPDPVPEPKPIKIREVTFFTHYRAFPSEGFYGLGYGDMVGPLNEAMNTIINQNIDRGTVNNSRGGFISRQLRFNRGPITMQPGQYVEIDAPPAAMKDGLQSFPAIPGDPGLDRISNQIEQWAQRTAGSGDTLSGEPIGANETAKAAVLRNQAAQKQITILGSRVISYMKNDADMLWRLFSVFLDEAGQSQVMTKDGQPTQIPISRADFIADSRVYPAADPRITSREDRIADADAALAKAMQNPMTANNPKIIRALTERQFHAADMVDLIPLLDPVPPPPPPPMDQHDENAAFLEGQNPPVNPADNPDDHLQKIAAFKQSPESHAMTPEQMNALDQHARNHVAQKIHNEAANARNGSNSPIPGSQGGGPVGMAGPANNPPVPGGPPGAH